MKKHKKVILMILDGWGIGDGSKADVIANADIPFMKSLPGKVATAELQTSGEDVGLPDGQMGNSEVGHLNLGAGRIIYQDLVKINIACKTNTIAENKELQAAYAYARNNNKSIHFLGLVSDGGVHSMTSHLTKMCDIAHEQNLENVFIHICTDGRDTDPRSGLGFVRKLQEHLSKSSGKIASLVGRYYTMDRDKRWERVKVGYDLLVNGTGTHSKDILNAIQDSYNNGVTDEFIKPIVIVDETDKPIGQVKEGDVFICFNFRTDRLREITTVLSQKDMPEAGMKTVPLYYATMTRYDENFKNVHILFDKDDVTETMGEVLEKNGLKQLRIAETEKYPHVTFFFSGGRETPFIGESRVMIPSPKVATYDLKPSMSAVEVKDAVLTEIKKQEHDFICLNFANADMVGHTGIYTAILEALKTVDKCVQEVCESAQENGYSVMIIADHGNADFAINADGSPNTAHTNNPVPCYLLDADYKTIRNGKLCDVAPTLLTLMGVPVPKAMTGEVLIQG